MKWSAHRLNRLSSGTTISYLSREEFEKFKIVIPKKFSEQRKIAQILSTWDEAIEKQEQLILKKGTLKKGLMQQLLTGKKRFAWFTEEWKFVRLGDVLDYEQPTNYIVESTDYNNSFKIPVLTAGKTFVLGFTNEEIGIFKNNLPVIIFDDFTTANKFVDFPFKVKSSAMKILKIASEDFDIKFLFEKIQLINFMPTDHKRYWISQYSDIEIKVPSYREQKKIADVLSAADNEIENLQQKLDILKEQKKGLMQKLFTQEIRFKDRLH